MYTTYYTETPTANIQVTTGTDVWGIVATVISIVAAVLIYFLFVSSKTQVKGKFAKWLKEFLSFKIMWLEPIIKMAYYYMTIFVVLISFSFLQQGANGVLYFFLMLIGGPILIRVTYEFVMLLVGIWRNTKDIADNTKKK